MTATFPNPNYDPADETSLEHYTPFVFAESAMDRAPRHDSRRLFTYMYGDADDVRQRLTASGKSNSEIDLDLAALLARYASKDPAVIEAVMRESALKRGKWDAHRTWLATTIRRALRETRDNPDPATLDAQPEATVRWRLYTEEQLLAMPEPNWLVRGALFAGGLTTLYGLKGTYKSFVALSLAAAVATGEDWLGRYAVTQGAVVYVVAEGKGFFRRRVEALGLPDGTPIRFVSVPVNLFKGEAAPFAEHVKAQLGEARPAMFVFDTMARSMVGGDENSNSDMAVVVAAAQSLQQAFDAAVLIVHHTGKDGLTARGASALPMASDVVLKLEKTGDKAVRLVTENTKDMQEPEPLPLALESRGQSLVVAAAQPVEAAARDNDEMGRLMEALARITVNGQAIAVGVLEAAARERGIAHTRFFELMRDAQQWPSGALISRPNGRTGGVALTAAGRAMCRPEIG